MLPKGKQVEVFRELLKGPRAAAWNKHVGLLVKRGITCEWRIEMGEIGKAGARRARLGRTAAAALAMTVAITLTAGPASAADVVSHHHSRQRGVGALYLSTDPTGCVHSAIIVNAAEGTTEEQGAPGFSRYAYVAMWSWDVCTERSITAAAGSVDVTRQQFAMRGLESATLETQVPIYDFVRETSFTVDVRLRWEGIGTREGGPWHVNIASQRRTDRLS